jgi:hypothetical protein
MIINNFGTSNLSLNNQPSSNSVHQTINNLQQELANVKSEIRETKNDSDPKITITTNSDPSTQSGQSGQTVIKPPPVIFDPIANYDQAKLLDPLVDPRGRTSADQIPAPQVAAQFNFPTQGVLDRYHRVGLLIAIDTPYDNEGSGGRGVRPRRRHAKKRIDRYPDLSDNSSSDNSTNSTSSSQKSYKGVEIAPASTETFESFGNYMDEGPNGILELIGKKITDNWYKYFTSISKGNKIIKIVVNNRNRRELYSGDEVYIPELHRWYRVQMDEMDMIEYNPYLF